MSRVAHQRFKVARLKLHLKKAIIATDNFCMMLARNHDARARLRRVTGAQLRQRERGRKQPFNQNFNHATTNFDRTQTRVEHFGVIEDEQIAGLQ